MTKLKAKDLFQGIRLLKAIDFKEESAQFFADVIKDNSKTEQEKGMDFIMFLMDLATEQKCENEIYKFLASPFEMTSEEVANLDALDFLENVTKVANFNEWKDFFSKAVKAMK